MPPIPPELQPDVLEREIRRLLPAVQEGRRRSSAQKKAELAALLYEAHRSGAYRAGGYATLGQYATELGMNSATFAKYKTAGKVLRDGYRPLYDALMLAVVGKTQRPPLPTVSELALQPSLQKQIGADHEVSGLLASGVAIGKVSTLVGITSYGKATSDGRHTLSALDAFVQDAKRTLRVLREVPGDGKDVPTDQLPRRLANIRAVCQDLLQAVEGLEGDED